MRGEQNRVRNIRLRDDLSSEFPNEDIGADLACSAPGTGSQTNEVDALVDAFLDELNALSGDHSVVVPLSSPESPTQEPGIDSHPGKFPGVSGGIGTVQHSDAEEVPVGQHAESAGTPASSAGDPSNVAVLTLAPEGNTDDIGPSREATHAGQDSPPPLRHSGETDNTPGLPLVEMPPLAETGISPHNGVAPGSLFQEWRKDRSSVYRATILVLISVAVLAACYIFLGFIKPAGPKSKRSDVQPPPVVRSARTDTPSDIEMPIWPAGSDSLSVPGNGVTAVPPDAGVLQITQPVAIKKMMPPYPKAARSLGIDGPVEVDVSADLDDKGNVLHATALEGPEVFRSAAEKALMQWSFKPAADKGVNIRSTVRVTIVFKP